ncbi:hypothetical protein BEWA_020430 [Theileria equi strain WA]|uniref:GOLD domain-containing protein n=1 Tax=Theileria equi strain WA TaxID=1537102 RepID=L0AU75_THEEQ|nr:hypothetical protein BEWA_020430 [Theileria equi strain WA]AFZ79197.1 hypothetical protein BEWA_020430 [Theileria equi strain WA]|eukprot:XP_004828863.1 hypothetical protein BEWA_020430 [Theileria equi strain WA]
MIGKAYFTQIWCLVSALFFISYVTRNVSAGYIDATTYLKPYEQFCISEVVGKDMYTHITFSAASLAPGEGLSAFIMEEGGDKHVYNEKDITKPASVSFTTIRGLSVIFCITGPPSGAFITFTLKYGADARDYSIIAKSSHLDPVDARIQNVLDEFSAFHKAQIIGTQSIDKTSVKATETYHLLAKFAIANSLFVIFSTIFYIYYFRNFFRSKKLI